jgi:hypothetical protein
MKDKAKLKKRLTAFVISIIVIGVVGLVTLPIGRSFFSNNSPPLTDKGRIIKENTGMH